MSRVDFYHLETQNLEAVLPKLLEKAYGTQKKIIVRVGVEEQVEFVNAMLWTYDDQSFLPHGSKKDGNASMQPIWITAEKDNPNQASFLFLVDGASAKTEELGEFERIFNIFDGHNNEAVVQAREFWKNVRDSGNDCYYWQQNELGKWDMKASTVKK